MPIQNAQKIKEDILTFLEFNGPSLPVQISRAVKVDTLFISAFLSELLSDQKLKISSLKVGSSPIYYLSGTEAGLEKYTEHLKSKEKEAHLLLKQNLFLEDEKQEPAIKVALREIRDYAKAFEFEGKIIWRYYLIPEQEYKKKTKENIAEIKPPKKEIEIKKEERLPTIKEEKQPEIEEKQLFVNPLAKKEESKKQKEKQKSDFVKKIINFIEKENWQIIEELNHKSKEYNCLLKIETALGPIVFKTQAKDKKSISDTDLMNLLSEAQSIPLPALIISPGKPQKKAEEILEKYSSVLKFKKI